VTTRIQFLLLVCCTTGLFSLSASEHNYAEALQKALYFQGGPPPTTQGLSS